MTNSPSAVQRWQLLHACIIKDVKDSIQCVLPKHYPRQKQQHSVFNTLLPELVTNDCQWCLQYLRMNIHTFEELFSNIEPKIARKTTKFSIVANTAHVICASESKMQRRWLERNTGGWILPLPLPSFHPLFSPPLEAEPFNPARGLEEHCKLPHWGLGQTPAEIEFSTF